MSRVREKRIELFKINKKLTLPLQGLENKEKKKEKRKIEIKGIKMLFVKKNYKRSSKKERSKNITIIQEKKRGESKCTWEQRKKSTRGFRKVGATA